MAGITTDGAYIYEGPWINWEKGFISGATITLSSRNGGLFTAFLGIFVTLAGGHLWRIVSFIIHQSRASRGPQDGLYHQQQNIFRNTNSPGAASWQFTQLLFGWWSRAKSPAWRSLPWAVLGVVYLCAFGLAGIFSSQVTKAAGNDRLIRGPNCGYWALDDNDARRSQLAFNAKLLNETLTAASYARACYNNDDALRCNVYKTQQIPWSTNQNATCPFKGLCIYGDTAAYSMDTGLFDSDKALGLNSPSSDRVQFRRKSVCAPIHTANFVTVINATAADGAYPGDTVLRFWFGPVASIKNWTFEYNTHTLVDEVAYGIQALQALAGYDNTWTPTKELNRTDADVTIIFITPNSVRFDEPVYDPVFLATTVEGSIMNSAGQNISWYTSDYYASVMTCADQYQFCNPNSGNCTPLTGQNQILAYLYNIGLSTSQVGIAMRIYSQTVFMSMYLALSGRGPSALRVTETLYDFDQGPLPINQWHIELSSWFAVTLARLQQGVVEYATGPSNLQEGLITRQPGDSVSQSMCRNQKVRYADGTISFSVIGVSLIIFFGGLIILVNLILDTIVGILQVRFHVGEHRRLNWILDEKLQLQRLAFEEAGMGTWEGTTAAVPVTKRGEKFGGWDDLDPEHPRLKRKEEDVENTFFLENDEQATSDIENITSDRTRLQ